MRSAVERHRQVYRKVVVAGVAASAAIHVAVLGLVRFRVDAPEAPHAELRAFTPAEPAREMQVVRLEPETPVQARTALSAQSSAPAAPASNAVAEAAATASAEASQSDAPPLHIAAPEPRRALPAQNALGIASPAQLVAEDVRATVPAADVGGSEDEEKEEGEGSGLRGVLNGLGGILGGIKVSGGVGQEGSGGKGPCVPGIGGIIGGRNPPGTSIPQRPAVGPRGIGGRGGPPMRFRSAASNPAAEGCTSR